jgi:hypothetical protein
VFDRLWWSIGGCCGVLVANERLWMQKGCCGVVREVVGANGRLQEVMVVFERL